VTDWSLAAAHRVVAAAVPDRDMVVWESTRRTYGESAARTDALARLLRERGLGARRERAELGRWECGQSTVAIVMYNRPEYLETMLAAYKARAVPFNVNQHYRPHEVAGVVDMLAADAIVYEQRLAPLVAEAVAPDRLLLHVADGSDVPPVDGSLDYESVIADPSVAWVELPTPDPDDLYVVCTGGTTGFPKAVLWRQADIFVAGMGGGDEATRQKQAANPQAVPPAGVAGPPLPHASGQWTAFAALNLGATVVLHDDSQPLDARRLLETLAREKVSMVSIVGDAYARPIVDELRRRSYDLSPLRTIGTGGSVTSAAYKQALLELLPRVTIIDGYGASETGAMAYGTNSARAASTGFAPGAGAAVLSADRQRLLAPGDDEIGWTARRGHVMLGYLDDPERTASTFPVIDGERYAVPGDRATVDTDGTIRLLGRDATVVNTGGEKVFVEEVEEVLRQHPLVVDALVVGRPSARFGEEVVAVVQLDDGAVVDARELREFVAASIARFKAPRAVAFARTVERHASGKPDYRWAATIAATAVSATEG